MVIFCLMWVENLATPSERQTQFEDQSLFIGRLMHLIV